MAAAADQVNNYFKRTDLDGNGFIDTKEFNTMLRRMGIILPADDEARLFKAMDASGRGMISLQDFMKNYATVMALERKAEEKQIRHMLDKTTFTEVEMKRLLANFKKISTSMVDDGVIDKMEFRAIMAGGAGGEPKNSVFYDSLFRMFDRDGSGEIDFQKFASSLALYFGKTKTPLHSKERGQFLFNIFDMDRDGAISAQDLRTVLTDCLAANDLRISPMDLERLVQATIRPYGKSLSLADYQQNAASKASHFMLEEEPKDEE